MTDTRIYLEDIERKVLAVLVENKFLTTGEHLKILVTLLYKLLK